MARFLFSVLPTRGHMYPTLPIAHALRADGHDVAFVTVPEFRHLLDPAGFGYFPLEHLDAGAARIARPERRSEEGSAGAVKAAFRASFIAPIPSQVQSLRRAIASWGPDVLVNDYVSYAPLFAAELEDVPIATLTMTVSSWPGVDLGPFGRGLPPARDAETRLRYAALRERAEGYFGDIVAEFNDMRASFGLPPRPGPLAVATVSPYLQLIQTIPALDYERNDLPGQMHYIGPCAWDPPAEPDAELDAWLAALPSDQPLVLAAASGAFTRSAALVEAALSGLPNAGVAVLATLPFDHPLHMAPPPEPARVARFVPHSQVLPRADAVVAHGGFGTVTKALGAGLPLVVVPYAGDQPEVAQRVVAAGAGLRLDPASLTPASLRGAVMAVLADRGYRDSARQLAAGMARSNGPAHAAALLAHLARTRRPVLRTGNDA